ncbi:hypothetical protein D3C80_1022400 [compost metagenome]
MRQLSSDSPFSDRVPSIAKGNASNLKDIDLLDMAHCKLNVQRNRSAQKLQLTTGGENSSYPTRADKVAIGIPINQHRFLDPDPSGNSIGQPALIVIIEDIIGCTMLQIMSHHNAAHMDLFQHGLHQYLVILMLMLSERSDDTLNR